MRDFSEKEALRKVKQSIMGEASWTGTFQQLATIVWRGRESSAQKSHLSFASMDAQQWMCTIHTRTFLFLSVWAVNTAGNGNTKGHCLAGCLNLRKILHHGVTFEKDNAFLQTFIYKQKRKDDSMFWITFVWGCLPSSFFKTRQEWELHFPWCWPADEPLCIYTCISWCRNSQITWTIASGKTGKCHGGACWCIAEKVRNKKK